MSSTIAIRFTWADAIRKEYLKPSATPYTCPWKGEASYYTLVVADKENKDAAWY